MRRTVRLGLLLAIVVLYVVSIPWYRETGQVPEIVFGLPDWVALALGCYVLVAVFNCIAWLLTDVADPPEPGEGQP
jgi:hypothetical protein